MGNGIILPNLKGATLPMEGKIRIGLFWRCRKKERLQPDRRFVDEVFDCIPHVRGAYLKFMH